MGLFYHFLANESLSLLQCIDLMLLFAAYVAVICYQQWYGRKDEKEGIG